jgi:hypothetical protein
MEENLGQRRLSRSPHHSGGIEAKISLQKLSLVIEFLVLFV